MVPAGHMNSRLEALDQSHLDHSRDLPPWVDLHSSFLALFAHSTSPHDCSMEDKEGEAGLDRREAAVRGSKGPCVVDRTTLACWRKVQLKHWSCWSLEVWTEPHQSPLVEGPTSKASLQPLKEQVSLALWGALVVLQGVLQASAALCLKQIHHAESSELGSVAGRPAGWAGQQLHTLLSAKPGTGPGPALGSEAAESSPHQSNHSSPKAVAAELSSVASLPLQPGSWCSRLERPPSAGLLAGLFAASSGSDGVHHWLDR